MYAKLPQSVFFLNTVFRFVMHRICNGTHWLAKRTKIDKRVIFQSKVDAVEMLRLLFKYTLNLFYHLRFYLFFTSFQSFSMQCCSNNKFQRTQFVYNRRWGGARWIDTRLCLRNDWTEWEGYCVTMVIKRNIDLSMAATRKCDGTAHLCKYDDR